MATARLITKNLSKQFHQGPSTIDVLKGISVTFEQGSTYAITGSSGSGKSTLLHLLAGLDTPTTGIVTFNNRSVTDQSGADRSAFLMHSVGLVFQLPYLIPELSVIENVYLKGLINNAPREQCIDRAYELLKIVNLEHKANDAPATLSGGQQQRIAIIRALFLKPTFLIADEPTGNLDEKTSSSVINFINDCQKEWRMGLIISSHDAYVAKTMEYTYYLHNGTLTTTIKEASHERTTI